MLLDLNKFFSNENGANMNESTSTPKTRRKEDGSHLGNHQSMFSEKPLKKDDKKHYQLKSIDDNPLDLHNRRLYLESDNHNTEHEINQHSNNNNVNKDEHSNNKNKNDAYNFPVVDLGAVDWDYEGINKPFKWSEIMIREAIGKENETKVNSESYPTISTTIATTVRVSTTTTNYPIYNFDLMKLNHEDSGDDITEARDCRQ